MQMGAHEFARLVDEYGPALILYARQWCGAPEDVVQDAFLKLVVAREPPREIVPWLYRVVRNGALDIAKTSRRREQRERRAARPGHWFVEPGVGGPDPDPTGGALKRMPLEQTEVHVARLWGCLWFDE